MLTDRPIPGQSITTAPKSFSYERPPDVTNPLDALELHFDKLNDPRGMEDIGYILESNIDLVTLTEGQLRSAVANGFHSIDISLLIAPIIHEYIKGIALAQDIDFDEGFVDEEGERRLDESRVGTKILRRLREERPLEETVKETKAPTPPEPQEEMPMDEQSPDGLMTRRA